MKLQLATPLKNINFSTNIKKFWNENLFKICKSRTGRYSPFSSANSFPEWDKLIEVGRIYELFENLSYFNRMESYAISWDEFKELKINSPSIQALSLLNKENIEISEIFINTQELDPNNSKGWSILSFANIYLEYLNIHNKIIPEFLIEQISEEMTSAKKYSSHRELDEDINIFFNLLKVIPQKKITYDWFSEKLNLFSSMEDDNRNLTNNCQYINYDSQKKIYDYINLYYPEKLIENKKYYPKLLEQDIFSVQNLYQSSIDINIIQLLKQYNLTQKDSYLLVNIAIECLNVVSSPDFMKLLNEDIIVSNINKQETTDNLKLTFSVNDYNTLKSFEKIVLTSLKSVFQVHDKIKIQWQDGYDGDSVLITNMNANFIFQHYLFNNLSDTLDNNNSKNKKPKI